MKYLLLTIIAIFLVSSCDLKEEPTDTATKDPIFSTQKGLQLYVNSFYDILPNGEDIPQSDNMSDYVARTGVESFLQPNAYGPRQSSGWSWGQLRNINYFIANCTDNRVPIDVREHYIGIARLFRAIFYFEKVKRFGDVPWVDRVLKENDEIVFGKRDPRDFVMQKVLEDLNYACDKITTTNDATRSTITKYVAYGYKSRICLFEASFRKYHTNLGLSATANDWFTESANAAEFIMINAGLSIYDGSGENKSYRDLFISKKPIASEIMLAYLCDASLKVTTGANRRFISPTYGVRPSLSRFFVHTYLNIDGTPYTDVPNYNKKEFNDEVQGRDKRLAQTIRQGNYTRTSNGVPVIAPPDFGITFTGYQPIKFCYDEMLPYDNESLNDNAITRMRYAEILLNYAEAKAELGKLTNNDWEKTIGVLRKRAGIKNGLNTKPTKVDTYMQTTFYPNITSAEILEIRRERAIELVFEGFRFADLLRWRAGNLVEKTYNGIYVPAANTPMDLNGDGKPDVRFYIGTKPSRIDGLVDVNVSAGQQYSLSNVTSGELIWNPGVREWLDYKYLYPIPQDQINLNSNLLINGENNGWPQ